VHLDSGENCHFAGLDLCHLEAHKLREARAPELKQRSEGPTASRSGGRAPELRNPVTYLQVMAIYTRTGLPLWMQLTISRFPEIFLSPNPMIFNAESQALAKIDPNERCNLRFGFECDPGWTGLIEEIAKTATDLVSALRSSGLQTDAWIASSLVREKFGKLNWQGDSNLIEPFRTLFFGYTRWVSERSLITCEVTGKPGRLRDFGGWKKTLCDDEHLRESRRRGIPPK
jgi:hypothetical protein